MHWLTAIAALLGFYSVAGALYTLWNATPDGDLAAMRVWATLFVIAVLVAILNQWRLKAKQNTRGNTRT